MGRLNGLKTRRLQKLRKEAYLNQGRKCYWCHHQMKFTAVDGDPRMCTADHIIPHAKGGKVNNKNIVAACFSCNQSRAIEFVCYN